MSGPLPALDLDDVRRKATAIHERRKAAIAQFEQRIEEAAAAEREYRKAKAVAFAKARAGEHGVGEASVMADGATADLRYARDVAAGMVQAQRELLASIEADRAMLNRAASMSMEYAA